jgi:hypothetical protein
MGTGTSRPARFPVFPFVCRVSQKPLANWTLPTAGIIIFSAPAGIGLARPIRSAIIVAYGNFLGRHPGDAWIGYERARICHHE